MRVPGQRLCRALIVVAGMPAIVTQSACAETATQSPESGVYGGIVEINGRERIGWDQEAPSVAELDTYRYFVYVDGVRHPAVDPHCTRTGGAAGYRCSAALPPMSDGRHTLELTMQHDRQESPRSAPVAVFKVAAP